MIADISQDTHSRDSFSLDHWEVDETTSNDNKSTKRAEILMVDGTFPTLQEWYGYKWRDHIKDTKYKVNINFTMKKHGDLVGPAVEGDEMVK